jgi:hypothetical protein
MSCRHGVQGWCVLCSRNGRGLIAAIVAAAALFIGGCSVPKADVDPNLTAAGEIVVRMAVRRGVSDYIAQHGPTKAVDRAARVKAVLDDLVAAANGEQSVTLAALKSVALNAISAELTPLEQQDARDVIELVALAIQGYIGQGTLNPEALVKVRDVLAWISQAAATFAPPA